jgi:hypothetical protein
MTFTFNTIWIQQSGGSIPPHYQHKEEKNNVTKETGKDL